MSPIVSFRLEKREIAKETKEYFLTLLYDIIIK